MMMQRLLHGQQVQAKALNQVTMEIDTRMGNMFTEPNAKYDIVASHIRKIDVQLAQTAESVKRQQGTLPGKTDKNPRTEHCNAIEQMFAETVLGAEENTEQKIDVQLAQTAESVKRQQGTLPGKTDKNPRTEHCNAIEQMFAETVLGAEENTEQSASS
ncbi:hypothetical protein DY000_02040509 [Brassica cretica]|uniref:Uncharacterized protein n=1 Tax=Brassica cretica TaxID=69181 RepID=A0ABQ7BFM9_BRACR|nr:hypothetical protein DY000_02040509 [Brassica cretica]